MINTPEFLVWAIEYSCPIRGFQDGSDPERTERQLRAARAVSDAQREGRLFEGICVDPPNGFRIEDALAIYGGREETERECVGCPANAVERISSDCLAGCFGITALSLDVKARIADALNQRELSARYEALFALTEPRWYGLWMGTPLTRDQCSLVNELFEALNGRVVDHQAFKAMQTGLKTAVDANLPFHVTLFPPGRVEGTAWRFIRHCRRCKGPWGERTERRCHVCGNEGSPAPDKNRKARGQRPYFPLDRLLGSKEAARFLVRFEELRAQQGLSLTAENRPRREPADNLRAD